MMYLSFRPDLVCDFLYEERDELTPEAKIVAQQLNNLTPLRRPSIAGSAFNKVNEQGPGYQLSKSGHGL